MTITNTKSNTLLVSWNAPPTPVSGYEVFYEIAAAEETHSVSNTTNTSVVLSGFDRRMCFYLRAYVDSQVEETSGSSSGESEEKCEVLPSHRSEMACLSKGQCVTSL